MTGIAEEGGDTRADLVNRLNAALARVEMLEAVLRRIADAHAWGEPGKWEITPLEVRQLAASAVLAPEQDK